MSKNIDFKKIETKWQQLWEKKGLYKAKDVEKGKKNFMLLTEFPYPSGNLHIGHWYAFAVPDILSRYQRMKGFNVMYPMGFDAFGLPAENAAIERKINPRDWTESNIKYMTKQLKSMGATFDWSRQVSTIDPEYYKWTQWIFLKMFEKGLAYRAKTFVNWCPSCKTVLANEQVINGKCERCGSDVIQKEKEQWMFKITEYADRLIDDLGGLDWPETTKLAQKNWIGRSDGTIIRFKVTGERLKEEFVEVFTTRVDTIYGCTYVVVAPENEIISNLKSQISNVKEVENYISEAKKKSNLQRMEVAKNKTGVELKGIKAINPFTNEKIPVFVADYVLGGYGTGAVMAVPAHDERDFEFATKYNLPVKQVILARINADQNPAPEQVRYGAGADLRGKLDKAFTENGILINSGNYTGMASQKAREEMTKWLEKNNFGKKTKTYRLHDWVLSRQRYWGVPIPMIKCQKCGYVPVPDKNLPVLLPKLKDFMPTSDGHSPLAKAKAWVKVKCPKCKGVAERETDTMDTFVDSSWYFIRYADSKNKNKFADSKKMKKWLPVPLYIGGAEHNTMHLLYSRFFTKVLYDLKFIHFNEPFVGRINHGVILGPDDNQKMSKSRGNVIDPDKEVEKFGADCVRMYLAFMAPYDQGGPWQLNGIVGIYRFLNRVWNFYKNQAGQNNKKFVDSDKFVVLNRLLHQTIKKVGEDIENLRFNTAISSLMILFNAIEKNLTQLPYRTEPSGCRPNDLITQFLILLSPFAPHLTEEIWQQIRVCPLRKSKNPPASPKLQRGERLSASIHLESWPKYDEKILAEEKIDLIIQVNGKLRDIIKVERGINQKSTKSLALSSEKVKNAIGDKKVKKVIFVQDKLINFVV